MKAEAAVNTVRSADGTHIAFDRLGEGRPVILVTGASISRAIHAQLAELLAGDFTVFNYDRRGRGDTGDTPPYRTEREVEALDAVITEAGGTAAVFGNSSGAVLALRAAAAGLPVTKLALWEPPFMVDPEAPRRQQEYVTQLAQLLDAGRRGGAMELFMRTVGLPEEMIAGMREEESALSRGFSESRRPDSNRGPLHYEGRMSRRRPTTREHGRAHSRWKLSSSSAHAVDSLTPACPS
jgi:pimeloyl-ACP methyl ester carboxylesterase